MGLDRLGTDLDRTYPGPGFRREGGIEGRRQGPALKEGGKVPLKLLIEVLNGFKGNAVTWLRKLAADLPSYAKTIKDKLRDILNGLRDQLKSLAKILPRSLGRQADELVDSIDEVARIADGKIDEAVEELRDGLNKSLDEGVDFEKKGAIKSKNTRRQTDAESQELPGASPSIRPSNMGRARCSFGAGNRKGSFRFRRGF